MANPQVENGYTRIANELMEVLIKTEMSGHCFRLTLLILRKTYGFGKKDDAISLTQMAKMSGLSKVRCSQIINLLELRKIVTVTEKCNGLVKKYRFNKDFETWTTITEKCNRIRKVKNTVTEKCNYNRNNTKEINPLYPPKGDGRVVASHDEDFERFWNAYPRKQGKGKLEAIWRKISPSKSDLGIMLKAIEIQKKSPEWKRESGRFIPSPTRWIAERRWEDVDQEPIPTPSVSKKREEYTSDEIRKFDEARREGLEKVKKILNAKGKSQ